MPSTTRDLISQPLVFGLDMDSDDVDAALALAKLTPDCPINQAFEAIAIWLTPHKVGGQRGNTNRVAPDLKTHTIDFCVNAEELALLERCLLYTSDAADE